VIVVEIVAYAALLALAYLVGSIPFGLVVGRLFYGVDVRQHGSGNIGTTNVFRVLGKRAGVAVLACDMLKAYVPAVLAAHFLHPWLAIVVAAAPVAGHMFSVFLKGKGGKGIAAGAAVVLALDPLIFFIIIITFLMLLVLTRYVSVASLAAVSLVPLLAIVHHDPLPYQIAGVLVAIIIWWAHRGNISRLFAGTENRATMPWQRSKNSGRASLKVSGGS
jgi:acyl phosphate:glycerol-3-phosphate acyltransferase